LRGSELSDPTKAITSLGDRDAESVRRDDQRRGRLDDPIVVSAQGGTIGCGIRHGRAPVIQVSIFKSQMGPARGTLIEINAWRILRRQTCLETSDLRKNP
jgi:hypothetical protein